MMLGIAPESWGAAGTVAGAIGTAAAVLYGRIQVSDKRAHELEMESVTESIARIEASQKAAWVHVDDLRINAVRRQDQDRLRDEFRNDMKALGDRVEQAITALRDDIHRTKV